MTERPQRQERIGEFAALIIIMAAAFTFTIALMSITKLRFADIGKELEPTIAEPDQIATGSIRKQSGLASDDEASSRAAQNFEAP